MTSSSSSTSSSLSSHSSATTEPPSLISNMNKKENNSPSRKSNRGTHSPNNSTIASQTLTYSISSTLKRKTSSKKRTRKLKTTANATKTTKMTTKGTSKTKSAEQTSQTMLKKRVTLRRGSDQKKTTLSRNYFWSHEEEMQEGDILGINNKDLDGFISRVDQKVVPEQERVGPEDEMNLSQLSVSRGVSKYATPISLTIYLDREETPKNPGIKSELHEQNKNIHYPSDDLESSEVTYNSQDIVKTHNNLDHRLEKSNERVQETKKYITNDNRIVGQQLDISLTPTTLRQTTTPMEYQEIETPLRMTENLYPLEDFGKR